MRKQIVQFFIIFILISFVGYSQHKHDHGRQNSRLVEKDRDRYQWQLPRKVMAEIGIKKDMVIADVGAGDGYFTIPLSKKVGETGFVYASDIDSKALEVIKNKSKKLGLKNIEIILGEKNDPKLPEGKIDIVMIVNTIHLMENLNSVFKNIKTSLKQEGKLVIVQWDAEKMGFEVRKWNPVDKKKYTMRTTLRRIYESNFEVENILTFLPIQNIYICVPKED